MSYLAKPSMGEVPDAAPLSVVRLLVVTDAETRSALREGLHRRFEITEAGTATEALSFVRARWFGTVVVDYELEDSSGVELLRQIATEFPSTHRVLISRRAVPDLRTLLDAGVVELFFAKPVDPRGFSDFFRST